MVRKLLMAEVPARLKQAIDDGDAELVERGSGFYTLRFVRSPMNWAAMEALAQRTEDGKLEILDGRLRLMAWLEWLDEHRRKTS